MAIKKAAKEKEDVKKEDKNSKYFYAVGKRKTAIATVRVYESDSSKTDIMVNEMEYQKYFPIARANEIVKAPLASVGQETGFRVSVKVRGGGKSAQADAARLAIARALSKFDSELKKPLRDRGYLTRDARKVERKKPGLRKARRSPQWAKR